MQFVEEADLGNVSQGRYLLMLSVPPPPPPVTLQLSFQKMH